MVEEADGEGAEMVVWGEEGGCLGGEGCGCRGGFGKGGGIELIGDDSVQSRQGTGFTASVGSCGGFEAEFGRGGDGKIVVRARDGGIGGIFAVTLDAIDIGFWGGLGLFKVKR